MMTSISPSGITCIVGSTNSIGIGNSIVGCSPSTIFAVTPLISPEGKYIEKLSGACAASSRGMGKRSGAWPEVSPNAKAFARSIISAQGNVRVVEPRNKGWNRGGTRFPPESMGSY